MPTTRPRHMITETPRVQRALDELRSQIRGDRVDFAELVVLGARAKLAELRHAETETIEARERLASMIRRRSVPVDVAAADEVKRLRLSDDA